MTHHKPFSTLSSCPHDVFKDAIAHGVMSRHGKKVNRPRQQLTGDRAPSNAYILEYEDAEGRTIGRLVKACGHAEAWLRSDLATETLIARADAVAEIERIKREMVDYCRATRQHSRDQMAETYVLSSALIHASARHQARIGRLWDQNSRGDRTRANLAHALDRAIKAEGAK